MAHAIVAGVDSPEGELDDHRACSELLPAARAGVQVMFLVELSNRIAKALMILAASWAFVLCFIILVDVTGRGLFNSPLYGTKEIVANSIVMIVFLQAGYAIRSRSMLRAEFLVDLFWPGVQRVVNALGYLLGALFFLIMVSGGIDPAITSFVNGEYEGEGALRVPVWPTRFMIVIGGALAILNYLVLAYLDLFRPHHREAR